MADLLEPGINSEPNARLEYETNDYLSPLLRNKHDFDDVINFYND